MFAIPGILHPDIVSSPDNRLLYKAQINKPHPEFSVLTDLQGLEDALGDMDFKVAGTTEGVTAIQMDIKIAGINRAILEQALKQAHDGRMFILGKMLEAIPTAREELSKYAPRVITMMINPDKIRDVIGPGGKVIKKIVEDTGVKIDIEDDGRVMMKKVEDVVKVGDEIMVKCVEIDKQGRVNLSRKVLLSKEEN